MVYIERIAGDVPICLKFAQDDSTAYSRSRGTTAVVFPAPGIPTVQKVVVATAKLIHAVMPRDFTFPDARAKH